MLVWALPVSLAATPGIDVSFFSSGYLDVSVRRVPFHTLWIGVWILEGSSNRFPHSDISGSMDICSSPKLFAAYHVFHRLSVPRHPPCALISLTSFRHFCLSPITLGAVGWFTIFRVSFEYTLCFGWISQSDSFRLRYHLGCLDYLINHR